VLQRFDPGSKMGAEYQGELPDLPEIRGIDTQRGLQLMQGDQQRYRHWLWNFLVEGPLAVTRVREALAAGDGDGASMAVHTLRGRAGLLGMVALFELSSRLEAAIDGAEPSEVLVDAFATSVLEVCGELRSAIGEAPGEITDAIPVAVAFPREAAPESVARLIERLKGCDCDCEAIAEACLEELKDTDWEPVLCQVLRLCRKYDFLAAARLFGEH
jgi:HPt (histidine-containing phosphotransfer) domain-containing protein